MQAFLRNAGSSSSFNCFSSLSSLSAVDLIARAKTTAVEAAEVAQVAAASAAHVVAHRAQAQYRGSLGDSDVHIHYIQHNMILAVIGSEEGLDALSCRLNTEFGDRMLVLKMSERECLASKFLGESIQVNLWGLPTVPLALLVELCLSSHSWIASDSGHVLIVQCFAGCSRWIVFFCCLLAFFGVYERPMDALGEVCKRAGLDCDDALLPSQRRYAGYFHSCLSDLSPTALRRSLLRVTLNNLPNFEPDSETAAFRPCLYVYCNACVIFASYLPLTGEVSKEDLPTAFARGASCMSFSIPDNVAVLAGDVLLTVRHVLGDGRRQTAVRLAFHTAFAPEGIRLSKRELDAACCDDRFPDDFLLEVVLAPSPCSPPMDGGDGLGPLVFEKARRVAAQLRSDANRFQSADGSSSSDSLRQALAVASSDADGIVDMLRVSSSGAFTADPSGPRGGELEDIELDELLGSCAAAAPTSRRELSAEVAAMNTLPGRLESTGSCNDIDDFLMELDHVARAPLR